MLNIGIAGMGYIGRVHYEAYRLAPGLKVVAAASSRAAELRQLYPELEVTSSYQELFQDERLDAVIICVPTYLHEPTIMAALAHRRHVLTEKPLALNAASASRILEAAENASVVFMVSQVLRFWPEYVHIKELMSQGALGRILSVTAHRLSTAPSWSGWFRDAGKSGGCLLDLQVHDLDFVFWTLGPPRQIQTSGLKTAPARWDHVHTVLTYDGAIASIECSHIMPGSWPLTAGIRVVGTSGAVEYRFRSPGDVAARGESKAEALLYCAGGKAEALKIAGEDMFVAQMRHFADCISARDTPRVCANQDSYKVMALLDASRQSAESGQPIRLAGI